MSTSFVRQTKFTVGEVDQINYKRTDMNAYLEAAQALLNCEVGTTGLAKKRAGMKFQGDVTSYANGQSRLFELVDENDDYYLVIGDNEQFHIFNSPTNANTLVTGRGNEVVTGRSNTVVVGSNVFYFIATVSWPYVTADLPDLDYSQDNNSLVLVHPSHPPARIFISSYDPLTFEYQVLPIYPYPAYDFNTVNYSDLNVIISVSGSTLTFELESSTNPGFNDTWVGGQIIGGGTSDINPLGYAVITSVNYADEKVTFEATIQIPFLTSGYATKGSQYSIRQPAWSADLGYPAKVAYYESRLWFGKTKKLKSTVFGSKINLPANFDVGVGNDTDAIVYDIGNTNSGGILWINAGKQLEIYCENQEFVCPQDENSALTPSTFSVRQQAAYGASQTFKPTTYLNDSFYITRSGNALIDFKFDGVGLAYVASNVSEASQHLMKNPIGRAVLRGDANSQDNFVYLLNNDNTITVFQYAEQENFAALTPMEIEENVSLEDIVSVDNAIIFLKYYPESGKYTIETLDKTVKMDSFQTAQMDATGLVTGLERFNGYNIHCVYNGQDFGTSKQISGDVLVDGVVTAGQCYFENQNGVVGEVYIGQLFDVEITPMYIFAGNNDYAFKKKITRIYVDYYQSLDFDINGKLVPYQSFLEIQQGLPLTPKTDTAIVSSVQGWNRFETLSITQTSPFDLQILSIGYQISSVVI